MVRAQGEGGAGGEGRDGRGLRPRSGAATPPHFRNFGVAATRKRARGRRSDPAPRPVRRTPSGPQRG